MSYAIWIAAITKAAPKVTAGSNDMMLLPPHAALSPSKWERFGWTEIGIGAALVILFLGIIVWLIFRKRAVVIPPPAVTARKELGALARQPETNELVAKVSVVLRQYLKAICGLNAAEVTTAELGAVVAARPDWPEPLKESLQTFLRACEAQKFSPNAPIVNDAVATAEQLIEAVEQATQQTVKTAG